MKFICFGKRSLVVSYICFFKIVARLLRLLVLPSAGLQQTTSTDVAYKQPSETSFPTIRAIAIAAMASCKILELHGTHV